jgi:hypothetical protein
MQFDLDLDLKQRKLRRASSTRQNHTKIMSFRGTK